MLRQYMSQQYWQPTVVR